MSATVFEIVITVDDTGHMHVKHPEGSGELRDCIYFLELAKATLFAKSLAPPAGGLRTPFNPQIR